MKMLTNHEREGCLNQGYSIRRFVARQTRCSRRSEAAGEKERRKLEAKRKANPKVRLSLTVRRI